MKIKKSNPASPRLLSLCSDEAIHLDNVHRAWFTSLCLHTTDYVIHMDTLCCPCELSLYSTSLPEKRMSNIKLEWTQALLSVRVVYFLLVQKYKNLDHR